MNNSHVIFRWLHLSDIHITDNDNTEYNTQELQSSLLDYLSGIKKDFNCMVISGDFRYAPDNNNDSNNVADHILNLASEVELSKNNIFTVPGNHDLNRNGLRTGAVNEARKNYNALSGKIEKSVLEGLIKGFQFYENIKERINNNNTNKIFVEKDNPHSVVDLEECFLLLLNTALTANGDDDKNKLIIGCKYVSDLLNKYVKKTSKPVIAVGHHGFDWYSEDERKKLFPLFKKYGINLYICGHSHQFLCEKINDNIVQVTVGCMKQKDNNVDAAFSIGELYENGTVSIELHKWDIQNQEWMKSPVSAKRTKKSYSRLYNIPQKVDPKVQLTYNSFSISRVHPIPPRGNDGVKYIWEKYGNLVESVTFNKRLKESINPDDDNTSAYTISTSIGCLLSAMGSQCKFCETGKKEFVMPLTAEDIALQCIFMAKYDMNCKNHPKVRDHKREFAFMGQGEPGYNYDAVKKAIMLNDMAMRRLNQKVSRYIISTCGISDFLSSLIIDTKNSIFENKVSLHFSLHVNGSDRDNLMPINKHYDYREFIYLCKKYHAITKDKIGVGVLLFNKYVTDDKSVSYNLTRDKLTKILKELDNNVFRIDLCTLNQTHAGSQNQMNEDTAEQLYSFVSNKGFECKLFSSFGDNINAGCGMLSSETDRAEIPGINTTTAFNEAVQLLHEVKEEYEKKVL